MQQKKIPVRMCAGCGEHFPKKELVRIVHTPQGEIHMDPTGRMAGRGADLVPQGRVPPQGTEGQTAGACLPMPRTR